MTAEMQENKRVEVPERRRATRTGVVISDRMDKTIIVTLTRRVPHPRYFRVVSRTSKFYAHDEMNVCKVGDVVTIVETRPMSRLKRWRVRSVVRGGQPLDMATSGAAEAVKVAEAKSAADAAKAAATTRPRRRVAKAPAGGATASSTAAASGRPARKSKSSK